MNAFPNIACIADVKSVDFFVVSIFQSSQIYYSFFNIRLVHLKSFVVIVHRYAPGIYFLSLIQDGKKVGDKKLILLK
jgi:hypothetical protein